MDATNTTTTVMDLVNSVSSQATDLADKVGSEAITGGLDLWFGFLGIDWTTPTWDLVILLFFLVTVLVYGFTLGRDRIVAILISTYLAFAVASNFPFIDQLVEAINNSISFSFQVSGFLVVFALLFFFLSRSRLIQGLSNFGGSWWQVILFSILQVGLLISIILSFLPDSALQNLSAFTKTIFVSDLGRFSWIVLPILALTFIKGRPRRRRWPLGRFNDLD